MPTLCLLCAAPGWAVGWAGQNRPLAQHAWPSGQPPDQCPLDLWVDAMQLALRDHLGPGPALQWCWARLPKALRPAWWPDAPRRHHPCREWALGEGLVWAGARRIAPSVDLSDLSDLAELWGALSGPAPQAMPAMAHWLERAQHPAASVALSVLACLVVHAALQWGLHPWLEERQAQSWAQLAQARRAEIQRLEREREQALKAEQISRTQRWAQAQDRALAPLNALVPLLRASAAVAQPQFFSSLRFADGAWTVQGVAGHEVELSTWLGRVGELGLPQVLQSGPATWPPEPEWGWPAWRFEWRFTPPAEAPRSGGAR